MSAFSTLYPECRISGPILSYSKSRGYENLEPLDLRPPPIYLKGTSANLSRSGAERCTHGRTTGKWWETDSSRPPPSWSKDIFWFLTFYQQDGMGTDDL